MDNQQNFNINYANQQGIAKPVERTFVANVFSWMAAALAITGITAYVFGTDTSYMSYLIHVNPDGTGGTGQAPTGTGGVGQSAGGFGHPKCLNNPDPAKLPTVH